MTSRAFRSATSTSCCRCWQPSTVQNDPTAGLAERLGDKSTRMMVMFGGMLAIGLVGFLLLTVLGAIF